MSEFALIERYFRRSEPTGGLVSVGIGDDCALLTPDAGQQWAVSTDTLVEGVHFFPEVNPATLGHKALAVNLSDLAACGATPRCFFLAIALPRVDQAWLDAFSRGLHALADAYRCVLAGGDTTRSTAGVTITITAIGTVPSSHALLRSGARSGDDIWVSGELGDAALGLALRRDELKLSPLEAEQVLARLEKPAPRVHLGERLRQIATSAIDVSDGLAGDLPHILRASGVGAVVEWPQIPRSWVLQQQPIQMQQRCALGGGDDYELLFTAPIARRADVMRAAADGPDPIAVSRIGRIAATGGLAVLDEHGGRVETGMRSFDHFQDRPDLANPSAS
ncbi:MAG: thiamine-phosphate kinase [Burkholderiaceae bacterium]|nr:thiamine-phosphate kinase [Burkholderiaceae bacterium]